MTVLRDVLANIRDQNDRAWLYLPAAGPWSYDSPAAVLESEEVPPELEDEPDAGIPQYAKDQGLKQVLPITVVQDVVSNVLAQRPAATPDDLFRAFIHYFEHDAFLRF